MRFITIGINADGKSCVVEDREALPGDIGQPQYESLWETRQSPPELTVPRRPAEEAVQDASVTETGTRWWVVNLPPQSAGFEFHRTDTIDYDVILSGEITLFLEDGETVLRPGDMVFIPGLRHGWRPGPEGCVFTAMMIGLPPV